MAQATLKLVAVGDNLTGKKTELLHQMCGDIADGPYSASVFENRRHSVSLDSGDTYTQVEMVDTTGQEKYGALADLSYADADVFLLCVSLGDSASVDSIREIWIPKLENYYKRSRMPAMMMVAVETEANTPGGTDPEARRKAQVMADSGIFYRNRIWCVGTGEGCNTAREILEAAVLAGRAERSGFFQRCHVQ